MEEIKKELGSFYSVQQVIQMMKGYPEETRRMLEPDLIELRECKRQIIMGENAGENFFRSRKLRDRLILLIEEIQREPPYSKRKEEKDGDKYRPGSGGVGPCPYHERRSG